MPLTYHPSILDTLAFNSTFNPGASRITIPLCLNHFHLLTAVFFHAAIKMGSSDLNLKKSWHVGRAANISAIAKAEADAIAERKKLALRLNEIKEERKKEEIQKQLAAAGGKPVTQRVEWMYSGGPGDGQNDNAANEAFLLGKRSLDKLLASQDTEAKQQLQKQTSQDSLAPPSAVGNARDTAAKIREDPLLAIRRAEQDAYGAMMNDPIKRRQLLASLGIDDSKQESKGSKERHHKHRHHHRRRHHRDDDDADGEERTRKRRRLYSPDRSRRRRRDDSRERTRGGRERSPARRRERSRSKTRGDEDSSRRRDDSRERGDSYRRRRSDSRERRDDSRERRRAERDQSPARRRSRSRTRGERHSIR